MEEKQPPLNAEIWEEALDSLYRLRRNYEESNPSKVCEYDRLELAHQSIRCFWHIYRLYVVWAQSLIAGRYMALESQVLNDAIEPLIDVEREDTDYVYECVGALHQFNHIRAEEFEGGLSILDATERANVGLTLSQQRRVFIDMCNTHCIDAWWAKDVQWALEKVELGQRSDLFEPAKWGRGKPAELFYARFRAVRYVCFLHGRDGNKLRARVEVGGEIGASEATLRYWEKAARKNEVADYRLDCAYSAGEYETLLSKPVEALSDDEQLFLQQVSRHTFKMTDPVENARRILQEIRRESLEDIRSSIAAAHSL